MRGPLCTCYTLSVRTANQVKSGITNCSVRVALTLLVASVAACGQAPDQPDLRVARVESGYLTADNLIVFHRGVRQTIGRQVLGEDGQFRPAGPTVVFVFRSLAPEDAAQLSRDRIDAQENTAYLLPEAARDSVDALRAMRKIGAIDPALGNEQLARQFGVGEPGGSRSLIYKRQMDVSSAELMDGIRHGASEEELAPIRRRRLIAREHYYSAQPYRIPPINVTLCGTYARLPPSDDARQILDRDALRFAGGLVDSSGKVGACELNEFSLSELNELVAASCSKFADQTVAHATRQVVCRTPAMLLPAR